MDEFLSSGFFVLRTPLLPFTDFLKLSLPTDAAEAHVKDAGRAANRAQLRRWIERPEVQEALWLASPDLLESIPRWRDAPDSAKGRKLDLALYRYFARMTARATPFGTFAACSVGEIGDRTDLVLGEPAASQRRTRLDMEYLFNLVEAMVRDRTARKHLRFRPNDTLHLAAGQYHHLQGQQGEDGRIFKLVATATMPALETTLEQAKAGATAQELIAFLAQSHPHVSLAEAEDFIEQLIASQVLAPELAPPVTGAEPVAHVLKELEQARLPRLAAALRVLDSGLRSLDVRGLGVPLEAYNKIVQSAEQLPAEFQPGRLMRYDPRSQLCWIDSSRKKFFALSRSFTPSTGQVQIRYSSSRMNSQSATGTAKCRSWRHWTMKPALALSATTIPPLSRSSPESASSPRKVWRRKRL
jgi:hypothetical protein